MDRSKLQILILAAGKSSRMGKPKQLLSVNDKTLLEVVITMVLRTYSGGVYCILGAHAATIKPHIEPYPVNLIYNPEWELGLASSIRLGIQEIEKQKPQTEFILLLLGDQPGISISYIEKMIDELNYYPEYIIASDYNDFKGVPVLFSKAQFDLFKNLKGDQGAKKVLNSDQYKVRTVDAKVNLYDIDTPADYSYFLKQLGND